MSLRRYLSGAWKFAVGLALVLSLASWPGCSKKQTQALVPPTAPVPPKAEKIKKELTLHHHTRIDNYYWLNQRDNPKVIAYLKAENRYLTAVMKKTEPLQEKLYKEITGRMKQEDTSFPYQSNGYYYYTRYQTGKEYPIYCRRKGSMDSQEEILLDVNRMAKGFVYYQVRDFRISPDNTLMAYGVDTVSRRKYTLHFKNLASGEIFPEEIPNTTGIAPWAGDNQTVFYTSKDKNLREYKIFKHRLGTPVSQDKEIYHEADETFTTEIKKSKSQKYLFIVSISTLSTEYRYLEANHPNGEFKVVEPRQRGHEYFLDHAGDKFYIQTNLGAKNFRLMETPIDKTSEENWLEIIPHRDDVLLEDFELFKDFLVVKEWKGGLPHLRILRRDHNGEQEIDFDEEAYEVFFSESHEIDTPFLRFEYTSLTTPRSIFDYDMRLNQRNLLKQEEVGGGFNPGDYQTQRLYAPAADGAKIPVSLVYKKGLEKNGNNPLYLDGYGSYGLNEEVTFEPDRLSLLNRGFIFAIAHIRGGQEMGRDWYENGKLLKKKNTFTDFIACAEFLVAEKFTQPGKLFAYGASAGGLLMGAVANMRPDLFKGIVAEVPYVDGVTTMLDETIPLVTAEFDEWGNPQQKVYYDYMLSYSPYDNVAAKNYPAMLVTTGLHDSQVQYWEPAKWVAKLRDLKTDNNPLLFYTDMAGGHSGASGRFNKYRETALIYAFVLDQLGIKE
jgi:oligopeptidase B